MRLTTVIKMDIATIQLDCTIALVMMVIAEMALTAQVRCYIFKEECANEIEIAFDSFSFDEG